MTLFKSWIGNVKSNQTTSEFIVKKKNFKKKRKKKEIKLREFKNHGEGKKIEEKNEGKNGIDLGNLKSIKNFKHFFFLPTTSPPPRLFSVSDFFFKKKN